MYFLKIYWFKGTNHLLDAEGGPKAKSIKNDGFKNMHILHKIAPTGTLYGYLAKFYFIFGFSR